MDLQALRPATVKDIPAVYALNRIAFTEAWSMRALTAALHQGFDLYVWYSTSGDLAAYYLGRDVADEVHIMQIAVAPACRRRGLATRLLQCVLAAKRAAGKRRVGLEVRASNAAAQALYARLGFRVCGRRPAYYSPGGPSAAHEDAVLMSMEWSGQEGSQQQDHGRDHNSHDQIQADPGRHHAGHRHQVCAENDGVGRCGHRQHEGARGR